MTRALLLYSPELAQMTAVGRARAAAWRSFTGSVAALAIAATVAWMVAARSPERFRALFVLMSVVLFLAALAPVSQRELLMPAAGPPLPVAPHHLLARWLVLAGAPFAMWWGAASAGLFSLQRHPVTVIGAWLIDVCTAALVVMLVAAVRWHLATYLPSEVRKVAAVVVGALFPAAGLLAAAAAFAITAYYIVSGVFISAPVHRDVLTLLEVLRDPPPMLLAWRNSFSFSTFESVSLMLRLADGAPALGSADVLTRVALGAAAVFLAWRIARRPESPPPVTLRHTRFSEMARSAAFRRVYPHWLRVPLRLAWVAYGQTMGATLGITTLLFALVLLRMVWTAWDVPADRYTAVSSMVGIVILAFGAHGGWPLVGLLAGGESGRRELMRTLPIHSGRLIAVVLACGIALHQAVVALQGSLWGLLAGMPVADAVAGGVGAAALASACVLAFAARTIRFETVPHRGAFAIAAIAIAAAHIEALSRWPAPALVVVEVLLMIGAAAHAARAVRAIEAPQR